MRRLLDGDPLNNYLKRAVTFNPGGALNDEQHHDCRELRVHHDREDS